jgi:GMP synthase-like glutamine amidotransferase
LKIGLLQCDHVVEELQPKHGDIPDLFQNLFRRFNLLNTAAPEVSLDVYDVTKGEYPDLTEKYAGFISSGSRYSVYDKEPWIIRFKEFVQTLYQQKKKFVGICFGHQMIAEALGGKCATSDRGWGIGVKQVAILKPKFWMKPESGSYHLIVSHEDQVATLPPNSEIIGGNAHCPFSIYTVDKNFLGIQGHPEFTPAFTADLMAFRLDRIGRQGVDKAMATLSTPTDDVMITQWIINFMICWFSVVCST